MDQVGCRGCGGTDLAQGWLFLEVKEANNAGAWEPESGVDPLGGFYCSLECVSAYLVVLSRTRALSAAFTSPLGQFTARDLPFNPFEFEDDCDADD